MALSEKDLREVATIVGWSLDKLRRVLAGERTETDAEVLVSSLSDAIAALEATRVTKTQEMAAIEQQLIDRCAEGLNAQYIKAKAKALTRSSSPALTLPAGFEPCALPALVLRFRHSQPRLAYELLDRVRAVRGGTVNECIDAIGQLEVRGLIQFAIAPTGMFPEEGPQPSIFIAARSAFEAEVDAKTAETLVNYFDSTGMYNTMSGELDLEYATIGRYFADIRRDDRFKQLTVDQQIYAAVLAASRNLEPTQLGQILEEFHRWRRAHPHGKTEDYAATVDPGMLLVEKAQAYKRWALRVQQEHIVGSRREWYDRVMRLAAEAHRDPRLVNMHAPANASADRKRTITSVMTGFLADQLHLTPTTVLDQYFRWREQHPDVEADEFLREVVPDRKRIDDINRAYTDFRELVELNVASKHVDEAHSVDGVLASRGVRSTGQSAALDGATYDDFVRAHPLAIRQMAESAHISRRIVEETVRRWAADKLLRFVKLPLSSADTTVIIATLPDDTPELSRSARAIRQELAEFQNKIRHLKKDVVALHSAQSDGVLLYGTTALSTPRAGQHTYMRAIETQYGTLASLLNIAKQLRDRGQTSLDGMSVEELYEHDIVMLKHAATFCWFHDPLSAVQRAAESLPLSVKLTRDLIEAPAGWWHLSEPLPIQTTLRPNDVVHAVLWGWTLAANGRYGIRFSTYAPSDEGHDPQLWPQGLIPTMKFFWHEGETLTQALARCAAEHTERYTDPLRSPSDQTQLQGEAETGSAIEALARFFAAGALWLHQRILVQMPGHIERHARKRLEREHRLPKPLTAVQIIQLRRRTAIGPKSPNHRHVDWQCRWIVSGHWREARVGEGRSGVKTIWIDSYDKGPDDKPLKVPAHRVFAVNR